MSMIRTAAPLARLGMRTAPRTRTATQTFVRNCSSGMKGQGAGGHPRVLPHDTLAPFNPITNAPEALVLLGLIAVPVVFAARNMAVMAPRDCTWDPETRGDFEKRVLSTEK